jgi:AcrR family transcriptional regulator
MALVRGLYRKTPAQRAKILDAALDVFGRSGFRGGSLREIAEAVGMSQAGLLHHFTDKTGVLTALLDRRDELAVPFFSGPRGIDTLLAAAAVIESNQANRGATELFCVLSAEATSADHPAHEYFVARHERFRALFTDAMRLMAKRGELRAGVDIESAAAMILAVMDGLQLQWLLDPTSVDVSASLRTHLQQLVTAKAWRAGERRRAHSAASAH